MKTSTANPVITGLTTRVVTEPVSSLAVLTLLEIPQDDAQAEEVIELLIPAARRLVEDFTGLLLTPVTLSVFWRCYMDDGDELPYGPVHANGRALQTGGPNGVDRYEKPITDAEMDSSEFPCLWGNYPNGVTVSYTAGYTSPQGEYPLPAELSRAVAIAAAELFMEKTGYNPPVTVSRNWRVLAAGFKRA